MHLDETTTTQLKTEGKIRCLIADDHVLVRQGIRRLLQDEPDIEIVGEAGDGTEAVLKVGVQAFLHGIGRARVFALDFLRAWARVYLVFPSIGGSAWFSRARFVFGMTARRAG